jgi:phenylacetate-coenzyme A ligase PaaK-like adenylate-forming protein
MQNERLETLPELDRLPVKERTKYQQQALLRLWGVAAHHPLTRDRFPEYRPEELTHENIFAKWSEIPPDVSANHLQRIIKEGEYRAFDATESGSRIVCTSGGSTGRPKLLVNTYEETLRNARFQGKGYCLAGITAQDTVATFGGSGTFAIDYCIYHALAQIGCTIVPFVDFRRAEDNCENLEMLSVSVLLALPSKLYPLAAYLEDHGKTLKKVRLVVTGGEPVSAQLKTRLIARFGANLKFGSTFCTSDHGAIGYQCPHCDEGEYHLHEVLQHVELIAADESGSTRELVVSNLQWSYMPVVRLRSGDCAEWTDDHGNCPCGRTSRKIKLLGRTADMIRIGGEKISGLLFSQLPERVGIHENLVQVLVRTGSDGRDLVEVSLNDALRDRYENDLRSALMGNSTFARMVREQRVIGPHFVGMREMEKEKVSSYGKLRVLRDMRR